MVSLVYLYSHTCKICLCIEYLAQAKDSCTLSCLNELLRKFEVLQYLSQKRQESNPKLLELQEQINTWMNSHANHNTRVRFNTELFRVKTSAWILTSVKLLRYYKN